MGTTRAYTTTVVAASHVNWITGEVAPADASRLASVLAQLLRVIEGADLEARIEALERAQRP